MKIEDIYEYFARPPVTFLSQEETVCYVLSVLLEEELYPTQLIERLEQEYPTYRLSDPVLLDALNFLEDVGAATSYRVRHGRGRPRRLYQLTEDWVGEAQKLAHLWQTSTERRSLPLKHMVRNGLRLAQASPSAAVVQYAR